MSARKRLFFTPVDSTVETVYTNLTGTITRLDTLTLANPAGGGATNVRLTIGADAAGTRVIIYPVPSGPCTIILYPGLIFTGTDIIQLASDVTDDVVVATGNGTVDAA